MTLTLRTYFALIFSVFIILFTAVTSSVITEQSSQRVEKQISLSLTEKANQLADQLDHFMWSRYGELTVLSKLETFQNQQNTEEITHLLNELKRNIPSYSWVGFTDETGIVKASTDDILVNQDISERPVFIEAREQTFIGDVHEAVLLAKLLPNPSGEPLQFVDISSPIFDDKGRFKGVLAAHLSWQWADEVKQSVILPIQQKEAGLETFIISKRDNTVLLGPKDMIGQPLQVSAVKKAQSGKNHWTLEKYPNGKRYLTGYALADGLLNYPGLEWTVLIRQPEDIAYKSVYELRNQIIILGLLFAILFAVMGWFLAGIISNPLRQLAITTERLRNGERVNVPIKRGIKDIETLSTSLHDLISTLDRTELDLGRMESIALLDKLTCLPNRLALEYHLNKIKDAVDEVKPAYAILYIDLDGFKKVNDSYGHHHGDMLLNSVASRLKECISSDDFICRLSGDEFIIVLALPSQHDKDRINKVGTSIIESLNESFNIEGSIVKVGCSIGTSIWPLHDSNLYQVVRYADQALYISKDNGKNQLTFFK